MKIQQIEEKVERFIAKHQLIEEKDEIVIGVSGGADSIALLHFLVMHQEKYQLTLKVAHINHGIREEAIEDANFVKNACRAYDIRFYGHNCNVKAISQELKLGEEEAGRRERYNFFISLTNLNGKIATAHNKNDQAETMLMRFLRGADIKGLGGILPKRGQIIRPILCLTREEIEFYCKYYQLDFRQDKTNFLPIYTRNKIRLECIPYIEEHINPNIVSLLADHGELYQEQEQFLNTLTQKTFKETVRQEDKKYVLDTIKIQEYPSYLQKRVILMALTELTRESKDITLKHVESIYQLFSLQSGKEITLPYGVVGKRQYHTIILSKRESIEIRPAYTLAIGVNDTLPYGGKLYLTPCDRKTFEQTQENMYTKYIDYDRIKDNLQLRTRATHDFISIGTGKKKLQRFFVDERVPQEERLTMPLIADGSEIVWIVGMRLSPNYYVAEDTVNIVKIQFIKEEV